MKSESRGHRLWVSVLLVFGLMFAPWLQAASPERADAQKKKTSAHAVVKTKKAATKHSSKVRATRSATSKKVASKARSAKVIAAKRVIRQKPKAVVPVVATRKAKLSGPATRKVVAQRSNTRRHLVRKAAAATAVAAVPAVVHGAGSSRLSLASRAALVMDADTGEILYGKNENETVSIASITKLMTAMVVLDSGQSLDELITVTAADIDVIKHSHSRMTVGTTLPRREMMLLALMSSENRAASALARNYPGGFSAAVAAMNRKAASLGMTNAHFMDGTGLNPGNRASASDLAKMVKAAAGYPTIHQLSTTPEHYATIKGYRQKLRYMNSNPLARRGDWDIGVTKTGYIKEAGMCLVMQARISARNTIMVLMDSWGKETRVGDAARVKRWVEGTRLAAQ